MKICWVITVCIKVKRMNRKILWVGKYGFCYCDITIYYMYVKTYICTYIIYIILNITWVYDIALKLCENGKEKEVQHL